MERRRAPRARRCACTLRGGARSNAMQPKVAEAAGSPKADMIVINLPPSDDPDVIIPDEIARPLLVSSFLMLVTAVLSALHGEYGLCIVLTFVFITSIVHWHKPRFSGWRRPADYLAVVVALSFGSYLALTRARSSDWTWVWFCGLALIGVIFVWNETMYYMQLQRKPTGGDLSLVEDSVASLASRVQPCCGVKPVAEGSDERRWVFRRVTWVHLGCVHVLANALALVMVLRGLQPRMACALCS